LLGDPAGGAVRVTMMVFDTGALAPAALLAVSLIV